MSQFVLWNILSLSRLFVSSLPFSLYCLPITPLHPPWPSSLPLPCVFLWIFFFSSFACSTITCLLTEGALTAETERHRERKTSATGLEAFLRLLLLLYWQVWLPASAWCCMPMSVGVIQQENEEMGVTERGKEGRMRQEKWETVKWTQVISSKSPLLSARD